MPNPKRRHSRQRRDKRRTHDKLRTPLIMECPNCKAPVLYHHVCPECGHYKGKKVIEKTLVA